MPYGERSKRAVDKGTPYKSFIKEIAAFYTAAWRNCSHRLGVDEIWEGIMRAADKAGELAPSYAKSLVAGDFPFRVYVARENPRRYKQSIWSEKSLDVVLEVVRELVLDVVGVANMPSGGHLWLYARSPVYGRFLTLRVKPRDPQKFVDRFLFKRVAVSPLKGSLCFVPPLNKVYRFSAQLKFSVRGDIDGLPCAELRDLPLISRGLIPPELIVEAPVPQADGSTAPGVGAITVVDSESPKHISGNAVSLPADGSIVLDTSYAPFEKRSGFCPVVLLFLGCRGDRVDGYYFGSLGRKFSGSRIKYYIPDQLFITISGGELAHLIRTVPDSLLGYYEQPVSNDLFESPVLPKCGILQRVYLKRAREKFKVPNPHLVSYMEAGVWLRYARLG